jgi:hypothetical protein
MTEKIPYPGSDRRKHLAVREIFPEACALLAPVLAGAEGGLGVTCFSLMHILQDRYPALSSTEAHVLATTIERLHREGRLSGAIAQ